MNFFKNLFTTPTDPSSSDSSSPPPPPHSNVNSSSIIREQRTAKLERNLAQSSASSASAAVPSVHSNSHSATSPLTSQSHPIPHSLSRADSSPYSPPPLSSSLSSSFASPPPSSNVKSTTSTPIPTPTPSPPTSSPLNIKQNSISDGKSLEYKSHTDSPTLKPTTTHSPSPSHSVALPTSSPSPSTMSLPTLLRTFYPSLPPQYVLSLSDISSSSPFSHWQHNVFSDILSVTLDRSKGSLNGTGRVYLSQCDDEGIQLIHLDILDSIFIERLSLPFSPPFSLVANYLLHVYKKSLEIKNQFHQIHLKSKSTATASFPTTIFPSSNEDFSLVDNALDTLRKRSVTYMGLILNDGIDITPPIKDKNIHEIVRLLCVDPTLSLSRTLPEGFLDTLVELYHEDLPSIFMSIMNNMMSLPMMDSYGMPSMEDSQQKLNGIITLIKFPQLANLLISHPNFIPSWATNGHSFQSAAFLGPHLSVSVSLRAPELQGAREKSMNELEIIVGTIREKVNSSHSLLTTIFKLLLKGGKPCKDAVVSFFHHCLRLNSLRRRSHFDPSQVSSEIFMLNVMAVLVKLVMPIVSQGKGKGYEPTTYKEFHYGNNGVNGAHPSPSATSPSSSSSSSLISPSPSPSSSQMSDRGYSKIKLDYFLHNTFTSPKRIDYDLVTRLFSTQNDIAAIRSMRTPSSPSPLSLSSDYNFNTECFFLLHECIHLGYHHSLTTYQELMKQLGQLDRQMKEIPEELQGVSRQRRDMLTAQILAYRVHLCDQQMMSDMLVVYDWTSLWITWVLSNDYTTEVREKIIQQGGLSSASSGSSSSRPSPNTKTTALTPYHPFSSPRAHLPSSTIPEYIISDILDFYLFLSRFVYELIEKLPTETYDGICYLIIYMGSKDFCLRNPQLRGELTEVLLSFLPPPPHHSPYPHLISSRPSQYVFTSHPALLSNLVSTLVYLYIEVEFGDRAYYTRFSYRHAITLLIDHLWLSPEHRKQFHLIDNSLFMRFANMICNDLVFILDEGLKSLSTIREIQTLQDDEKKWAAIPPTNRTEKEKQLEEAQRSVTGCLQLGTSTVSMLCYMTEEVLTPFLSPQFVERMASMLTYYVMKLAGPSTSELKVKNPQQYHFDPKSLLKNICGIIIHLSSSNEFLEKIASDERSYSDGAFDRALHVLQRFSLLSEREMIQMSTIVKKLKGINEAFLSLEDILGDIPEQYADELFGTIMTDPIELPKTKNKMDRSNIQRHLMNSMTNPFNRAPLTESELIELPELKKEIALWIEERKEKFREEKRKKAEDKATEEREKEEKERERERESRGEEEEKKSLSSR